jgi:hypothetical protein
MSLLERVPAKATRWILIAIATAIPSLASAAPCGAGLDLSDFTFRGVNADACAGPFAGNPNTLNDFNTVLGSVGDIGGGWNLSATSGGYVDWNGFRFSFSSAPVIGPSPASGSFWLIVTDLSPGTVPEYPIKFDLLLAPKAGNQWASYLFEAEEFTLNDTGSGAWFIRFNNNSSPNEPSAGLSHMSFLLRGFVGCTEDCDPPAGEDELPTLLLTDAQCDRECAPSVLAVPEPGTLALLGFGTALMAASRRRRR